MQTSVDILATLRGQHVALSRRYPIQRTALFGSWARGDAREDSDVDILVEVDPSIGLRFVELGDELEKALGRRVDLVSRRAIKPSLWERIEPELIDASARLNQTGCRPNGPGESSPGLRPKADALGQQVPPPGGLKGRESLQSHT
jgi:predicted nucleotidyltransferase